MIPRTTSSAWRASVSFAMSLSVTGFVDAGVMLVVARFQHPPQAPDVELHRDALDVGSMHEPVAGWQLVRPSLRNAPEEGEVHHLHVPLANEAPPVVASHRLLLSTSWAAASTSCDSSLSF